MARGKVSRAPADAGGKGPLGLSPGRSSPIGWGEPDPWPGLGSGRPAAGGRDAFLRPLGWGGALSRGPAGGGSGLDLLLGSERGPVEDDAQGGGTVARQGGVASSGLLRGVAVRDQVRRP